MDGGLTDRPPCLNRSTEYAVLARVFIDVLDIAIVPNLGIVWCSDISKIALTK